MSTQKKERSEVERKAKVTGRMRAERQTRTKQKRIEKGECILYSVYG